MKHTNTVLSTRLKDGFKITSCYRKFANIHFESEGWETILWDKDNNMIEQFNVYNSIQRVLELHDEVESSLIVRIEG